MVPTFPQLVSVDLPDLIHSCQHTCVPTTKITRHVLLQLEVVKVLHFTLLISKWHYQICSVLLTVAPELPVPDSLITIREPSSKNILIP